MNLEIDLSEQNAAKLRDKLAKFLDAATEIKPAKTKRITTRAITTPSSKEQSKAIRDWGRANGWEVSDRGRVPSALLDAFNATH